MAEEKNTFLEEMATALKDLIDSRISGTNLNYTQDPEVIERDIIEYRSRMRVNGMEKFNKPCFCSVVNLYRSQQAQEAHQALGAIIIYVEQDNAEKFLKSLGISVKLDDDNDVIMERTGEFAKSITDDFVQQLSGKGYSGLVLSETRNSENYIEEGVEFEYEEYTKFELNFYLWKEKILSIDITLAPPE